jgi:hypothetical protein
MAFDFPASPTVNQMYSPAGGPTYMYDGQKWVVFSTTSGAAQKTAVGPNLIVNPCAQISQENGFGTAVNTSGSYNADQWQCNYTGPTGGTHIQFYAQTGAGAVDSVGVISIGGTGTTYPTVAAGNYARYIQPLEGLGIAALGWGTSFAVPAVLELEVACSKVGTFAIALTDSTGSRSIVFPFTTVAGTGTYTRFSFAIPAATSGTWPKTSAVAGYLSVTALCGTTFQAPANGAWQTGSYLGVAGHTNLLSTASQSLNIRHVALYADPSATGLAPPFQVPNYDDELRRCMRYYNASLYAIYSGGSPASGAIRYTSVPVSPPMRTAASMSGATVGQVAFPAAVGTLAWIAGCIREARTSNAVDVNNGHFHSNYIANARM